MITFLYSQADNNSTVFHCPGSVNPRKMGSLFALGPTMNPLFALGPTIPIVPGFVDPEQPKLLWIPFTQYCSPSYVNVCYLNLPVTPQALLLQLSSLIDSPVHEAPPYLAGRAIALVELFTPP